MRKLEIIGLSCFSLLSSLSEVVSIASIVPFLTSLTNPELIIKNLSFFPHISSYLINLNGNERNLIFTIFFISATLIAGLVRLGLIYATITLSNTIGADLSIDLYRKTLYQPYKVHILRNSSEIISSVTQKVNSVTSMIMSIMTTATSFFLFSSIFVTLLFFDSNLTLISAFIFIIFYSFIAMLTKSQLKKNGEVIAHQNTLVIKSLQEGLGGIRDVILDSTHDTYCSVYAKSIKLLNKSNSQNSFLSVMPRYILETFTVILIAFLAFYSLNINQDFISLIPNLGVMGMGAQRILPLLQNLYNNWTNMVTLQPSIDEVFKLLEQRISIEFLKNENIKPLIVKNEIFLNQLSFAYPSTSKKILESVNLSIPMGSRIGIIGETGSGKSTFMDLLMGLIEPTEGKIFIDEIELNKENILNWRKVIAHVPQVIFLTDSSIAENIALGIDKQKINNEKLLNAINKSQLTNFVKSLPLGVNSHVGERGVRLSGGQRQRIGIARAIYRNANIIFFDEATSSLDNSTETLIMDEIYNLSKQLTIFIIAHRINTLSKCDVILELRSGKITKKIK